MNTTPDTPQNSTNSPAWAHWLKNNLQDGRPLFFVLVIGPFFGAMMVPFTTLEPAHLYAIPVIALPSLTVWSIAYGVARWSIVNAEKKARSRTQVPTAGPNPGAKALPRRLGQSIVLLVGVIVAGYIACVCIYVVPQMPSWITGKEIMSNLRLVVGLNLTVCLMMPVLSASHPERPSSGSQNQTLLGRR